MLSIKLKVFIDLLKALMNCKGLKKKHCETCLMYTFL